MNNNHTLFYDQQNVTNSNVSKEIQRMHKSQDCKKINNVLYRCERAKPPNECIYK